MSVQIEKLEKSMAKLTIEVSTEEFEKALQTAYLKNRGKISIQGFRKGKAPRQIIEKMYGAAIFYEDAANEIIPEAYGKAADECELEIVSRPEIDVTQIGKGQNFIFTATVAIKPEVTLGDYKGLEYTAEAVEVTDEEVDAEIKRVQEQNARTITVEDRAVENGDTVTIDFDGSVDGVHFDGGKAEDYDLTIGSHSFIDTFEDQLIGKNIGDKVDVNVTFPEEYHAKELAGKPALFEVVIKAIKAKELPTLDDDFASDVSDYDTFAEYKESIKKNLLEKKEREAKIAKENALVDKAIENATMEIADAMVVEQARQLLQDFEQRMRMQGLSMEQYMQFTGQTVEAMLDQMKPQALKRIQTRLVLEAIAQAEAIEVTEEEVNKNLEEMASMYNMEVEKLKEAMGEAEKEAIKKDLSVQKAVDLIVNAAK